MTKRNHPLEEEFDMVDEIKIDENDEIVIPEVKNLDLIIDLALKAYKDQMDVISLIEPKSRIKYLEIAERFLNQSKDAIYKKEQLIIQEAKAKGKTKAPEKEEPQTEGEKKTYSRAELLEMNRKTS